ncbi:MAG: Na/Pi cotransporter family protein [Spirochaetaceae bacterium]|jgi:phosphate:Na+ symporter|nr:Na/Pi cotransporter family protein [Spirochaetaceae bacterium]
MGYLGIFFSITGSLGLFLYGMKVMGDGLQQAAGQRMQKALAFMTGNRLSAVLTGLGVTAVIQSSSATTVMVVSFVNAGLLTLKQAIGVIMGANIGTTITAWIVSLIGFSFKISALAFPAVGIGFVMSAMKWKHKDWGVSLLGFGLLFMGLDFLTKSMPSLSTETLAFINIFSDRGFMSILLGTSMGLGITLIIHSSSAATAIFLTLAHQGTINYEMAAAMILGANIGTTIDAALAAIGAKPAAKQAALVHVLFNVIGTIWALVFFRQLLALVDIVTPGTEITNHLAMLHTVFNTVNTLFFFPFVNQFAALVKKIIKDKGVSAEQKHYKLSYTSATFQNTPELNIYRANNEIREMAGIVSSMYGRISGVLDTLKDSPEQEKAVEELTAELRDKEIYADEMREELTHFLMECARQMLNQRSERRISRLLRIVADLENMTDDCYTASLLLERSVKKDLVFKGESMKALVPYTGLVGEFLNFVQTRLGRILTPEESEQAALAEGRINKERNKLRKYGRKRIEAGENVKTELLFIDFIRHLEQLGDYCYHISFALAHLED